MESLPNLKNELKQEYETTKKFIDSFPDGKNDYSPHEKSMKIMPLATHVAEIFAWPAMILNTSELDFAKGDYQPTILNSKEELQKKLGDDYNVGKAALENVDESALHPKWTMKNGRPSFGRMVKIRCNSSCFRPNYASQSAIRRLL